MAKGYQIERRRNQLDVSRITEIDISPAEGEIIAKLDLAALTANNLTYAVFGGPPTHYWNFFPASETDWGVVPVWGYADIVESRHPDIQTGERFFGFWPSATHLKLQPDKIGAHGFKDVSPHRVNLPPVYNQYNLEGITQPADEEMNATFYPLFGTGYVLARMLETEARAGKHIILTSASSKTALATAYGLSLIGHAPIGLTSAMQRDKVIETGYYDCVYTYDQVDQLDRVAPTILIDFSGDGPRLEYLHTHLTGLEATHMVGFTHWTAGPPANLSGPAPQMFFAPDHWASRAREIGPANFQQELRASQTDFQKTAQRWLQHKHILGADAFQDAFLDVMAGRTQTDVSLIWRP